MILRHLFAVILSCAMAFGQAAAPVAPAQSAPAAAAPAPAAEPLTATAPIVTVKGVCDPPAPDCTTVITKAEFEAIVNAFQPQMKLPQQRQVGTSYGQLLTMAAEAKKRGLDKSPRVQVRTRIAVMQALAGELRDNMQEEAGKVTDADVDKYYADHKSNYEQADVERLIIPRTPQAAEKEDADETKPPSPAKKTTTAAKATAAKAAVKAAAKPAEKPAMDEAGMSALAAKLRARAAAGEDFAKLQAEAFKAANIPGAAQDVKLAKATRATVPPNVFDLKTGDVSALIPDSRAYLVFKMGAKTMLSLDDAKSDVKTAIKNERMQAAQKAVSEISTTTLNDAYFGPPEPAQGPGRQPAANLPAN